MSLQFTISLTRSPINEEGRSYPVLQIRDADTDELLDAVSYQEAAQILLSARRPDLVAEDGQAPAPR